MAPTPLPQPTKVSPAEKYKDLNGILDKVPTEVAVARAYRIENATEGTAETWGE